MSARLKNSLDPNADWGSPEQREARAQPLRERARAALARGEASDAMVLASDAVVLTPNARASLDLVDGLFRASAAPLELAPLSVSVALTACRARALALQGDLSWALTLLRHVLKDAPAFSCAPWLEEWLTPDAIRKLGLSELKGPLVALVKLLAAFPFGLPQTDPRLHNVRATAQALALVRREFSAEAPLYLAEILLRRRLGAEAETRAVATEAAELFPDDWGVLVSALAAERDGKRPDAALVYARRALRVLRTDASPLHDAALAHAEAGREAESRQLLLELVEDFPDYRLSDEARRILSR